MRATIVSIFTGGGGRVIVSPNILKLIVPPNGEARVAFKCQAVFCLNVGDASRAGDSYYAQKFLQYREAAEKLKNNSRLLTAYLPHATEFQFQIKLFRVLSSDCGKDVDVPKDDVEVVRAPSTRLLAFNRDDDPGHIEEARPAWLLHLPTRLLEAMKDRMVVYWHVRTVLIMVYKFTKLPLQDIQDYPEILLWPRTRDSEQKINVLSHGADYYCPEVKFQV
ncbi:hypothetical protein EDC04DRAFT_2982875 [Pisolithus marmoratus]|nr:hypothetical protein EDC04DRAFT_2982875 [Pisolithus marmoratus]